ncbi:MAG: SDR family oxidoreductase [Sphingomonas sp.]
MRFDGKCVVILGGSAGIGLAAARMFHAEGAKVALTGRDPESIARAAKEVEGLGIRSDLGETGQTRAAMQEVSDTLGGIDVLFVNAGVGGFASVAELTEELWDQIHAVNLRGAVFAIQRALPLMRDGGSIVVTGSIGAILAIPGNLAYAAAKAGLRAAVRVLAKELLPRKIRVNMVSPGPTETEIFKRGMTAEETEGLRQLMRSNVPMGRMGEAEEVARAALFLASAEASFITGVDLFVDGGCVEL